MKKHKHNHDTDLSDKFGRYAPLVAIFMHVFCCGIPLTIAILSALGLTISLPFIEHHENYEIYIFIFSGTLLLLSFVVYKRGCKNNCCIEHKKVQHTNKIILIIASALFFISLIMHLSGNH